MLAVARPGLFVLVLGVLSASFHFWLAQGSLIPLPNASGVEYLFISASPALLAAIAAGISIAVLAGHALVRRVAARRAPQPRLFDWDDVSYAMPLAGFIASAAVALVLLPAVAPRYSVWLYFLVDLRWWWSAALLAWLIARLHARLGGFSNEAARQRLAAHSGRWFPQISLVTLAVIWVVAGSPPVRFSASTHGDEPKYVRYCENFYQGLGFDTSALRPLDALPADFESQVWRNVTMLIATLPRELRSLAGDVPLFLADPQRKFNRATTSGDLGFFVGKNGGRYQLHTPGLSFLMFPAYYLDRTFGNSVPEKSLEWPTKLTAVNAFFLAMYALWALLIFRFVQACIGASWLAWLTTAALVMTMPVAAFAFQFYPEAAAGVLLVAIAHHILFDQRPRAGSSVFYGALLGYLPWLHVRFSALLAVLLITALVLHRREPRRLAWLIGGTTLSLGAFVLYAYSLTGSIMPTAMYAAAPEGEVLFAWEGVGRTTLAYLVDRDWGVFPHAPVYLMAVAGYWWMLRRRPAVAVLCALALAVVLVPSAGHSLAMGGTTPMRTIVSVLPFAAIPLGELLVRYWHSPPFRAAFGLLFVLSAHNALAYNLNHHKFDGVLRDWSVSGWKVNLLFPQDSRNASLFSTANWILLLVWCAILLALLIGPAVLPWRRRESAGSPFRQGFAGSAIAMVVVCGMLGTIVSASTGVWIGGRYLIPPVEGAVRSATLLEQLGHCAYCGSSAEGRVGTGHMFERLDSVDPSVPFRRLSSQAVAVSRLGDREGAFIFYQNDAAYPEGDSFWSRGQEEAEVLIQTANASHLRLVFTCGPKGGPVRLRVGSLNLDRELSPNAVEEARVPLMAGQTLVPVTIRASSAVRPSDLNPGSTDTRLLGCRVEVRLEP